MMKSGLTKRKRKKKSSKTKTKEKAWKAVREAVFIRDKYICQRCYKNVEGSDCHPSHVIPKGSYPWMEYDMLNVKTLCFHCHIQWWHKNPLDAADWFKSEFPDRWEYLQEQKKNQHKLSEEEAEQCLLKAKTFLEQTRSSF